MVVSDASIHNIMGGMESTGGVRLHNHRRKLKQRFDIIKKLGQGTYGKVQLGINKETGQEVAIKTIKKAKIETEADLIRIRREIQIMSSVQHPNIIHIYEVFENREKMVLVMEYAAGGELYDYLSERKVLSEEEARRIFRQISTAVYYCHKHKICHRDLKLENILLDEHGNAKIADFGLSNVFDEQRLLNTFCGSPLYASPEIVKGTPYHGPEVDCWSLGVLLYTLVYGAMPFDGSNFKRLVRQISQGDYFEPKKPSPASPLIREMLTVSPARRADIEKICSHWWVNEGHVESCLDIAEELANQTPVRLDLLLSLAPPGPGVGSDKLLVGAEQDGKSTIVGGDVVANIPARCHSVGSLMELDHSGSLRMKEDTIAKDTVKRKLEGGISTEEANRGGAKRKERSRRSTRDRSAEPRQSRSNSRSKQKSESKSVEEPMDVDSGVVDIDSSLQGSVDTIVGSVKAAGSSVDTVPGSDTCSGEGLEASSFVTSQNRTYTDLNKALHKSNSEVQESGDSALVEQSLQSVDAERENSKVKVKRKKKVVADATALTDNDTSDVSSKVVLDSVLASEVKQTDVSDSIASESENTFSQSDIKNSEVKESDNLNVEQVSHAEDLKFDETLVDNCSSAVSSPLDVPQKPGEKEKKGRGELSLGKLGSGSEKSSGANTPEDASSPPIKSMERRRSKIFETAEKFSNLISGSESKSPISEKPKKVFIPGVKVSDAKRAFEKKSSSAVSVPNLIKTPTSKKITDSKIESFEPENQSVPAEVTKARGENLSVPTDSRNEGKVDNNAELTLNETNSEISETRKKLSDLEINDSNTMEQNTLSLLKGENDIKLVPPLKAADKSNKQEEARIKKVKDAVQIISNAINEGHTKKLSSAKPPVPLQQEFKTKTVSASSIPKSPPLSPTDPQSGKKLVRVQVAPNDVRLATVQVSSPDANKFSYSNADNEDNVTTLPTDGTESCTDKGNDSSDSNFDSAGRKKSSKVEITLKSATLPRRKTSKAEIRLNSPSIPPVEYHTEVSHMIGPSKLSTQKSEAAFPVAAAAPHQPPRSASLEPEGRTNRPREHIIPIQLEDSGCERPPVPPLQQQRSYTHSQRSGSLSRQSTQDSDTDSTISVGPEPIRKSPREYIIPIAVEGGGYITPRAGSLEPSLSEENNAKPRQRKTSRFGRHRRMSSLLSDASEDEGFNSPFASVQRHSSLSRDREPETPEEERGTFHMHRLRSSRPSRGTLEHNDSLSSGEDDDDDDGFEILTAESLFSTLLSRVRSLTQRLNVEDGGRPGFPTSTLMSQLKNVGRTPPSRFWSSMGEPLSRRLSESSQFSKSFSQDRDTPWRRSTSRDVSDTDHVYNDNSGTLPRGSSQSSGGDGADGGVLAGLTPSLLSRREGGYGSRRLSRTTSVREERPPAAPRRSGSGSGVLPLPLPPLPRPSTTRRPLTSLGGPLRLTSTSLSPSYRGRLSVSGLEDTLERIRSNRSSDSCSAFSTVKRNGPSHIPSLTRFRRSASFSQDSDLGSVSSDVYRSKVGSCSADSPDRSVLSKFLSQDSNERKTPTAALSQSSSNTSVCEGFDDSSKKKTRKISRFLRPDFFDTPREESVYVKEKEAQKIAEAEAKKAKRVARRHALLEKKEAEILHTNTEMAVSKDSQETKSLAQTKSSGKDGTDVENILNSDPSDTKVQNKKAESGKNRFLQSLEKKLEKLRTGGTDASPPSRVEQAINSLRKQNAANQVPSESALLKRAVSVDDMTVPSTSRPVSSVLGLLRRMEGTTNRRTQSVYAGATSDTALLADVGSNDPVKSGIKAKRNTIVANDTQSPAHERSKSLTEESSSKKNLKKSTQKEKSNKVNDLSQHTLHNDEHPTAVRKIKDECTTKKCGCNIDSREISNNTQENVALKSCEAQKNTQKSSVPAHLDSSKAGVNFAYKTNKENKTHSVNECEERKHETGDSPKVDSNDANIEQNDKKNKSQQNQKPYKPDSQCENTPSKQKSQNNLINEIVKSNMTEKIKIDAKFPETSTSKANSSIHSGSDKLVSVINGGRNPNKLRLEINSSPFSETSLRNNSISGTPKQVDLLESNDSTRFLNTSIQEDSLSLVSPADETESLDSWSVCSDLENRDLSISSFPKTPSPIMEDESVEERIRRKSFYTRFNDIKRKSHRKSSSSHILGLKESISRKSSASDICSSIHPRKASQSQSLYAPDELLSVAYNINPVISSNPSNPEDSCSVKLQSNEKTHSVRNGHNETSLNSSDSSGCSSNCASASLTQKEVMQVVNSNSKCKQHVEVNGDIPNSAELSSEINHRTAVISRSRLPTPTRTKRRESENVASKQTR